MDKFKLIISGEFLNDGNTDDLNSLIALHFMGAAEYEGDATYNALLRIKNNIASYKLVKTGIIGKNNVELVVFTKNDKVVNKIRSFIKKPYELKRPSHLELIPKFDTRLQDGDHIITYSFWWCIDNSDPNSLDFYSEYGDWMAFYEDDSRPFLMALKNHLEEL